MSDLPPMRVTDRAGAEQLRKRYAEAKIRVSVPSVASAKESSVEEKKRQQVESMARQTVVEVNLVVDGVEDDSEAQRIGWGLLYLDNRVDSLKPQAKQTYRLARICGGLAGPLVKDHPDCLGEAPLVPGLEVLGEDPGLIEPLIKAAVERQEEIIEVGLFAISEGTPREEVGIPPKVVEFAQRQPLSFVAGKVAEDQEGVSFRIAGEPVRIGPSETVLVSFFDTSGEEPKCAQTMDLDLSPLKSMIRVSE